jgi:hypothetical protein
VKPKVEVRCDRTFRRSPERCFRLWDEIRLLGGSDLKAGVLRGQSAPRTPAHDKCRGTIFELVRLQSTGESDSIIRHSATVPQLH